MAQLHNLCKIVRRILSTTQLSNNKNYTISLFKYLNHNRPLRVLPAENNKNHSQNFSFRIPTILGLSVLQWLGFEKDDEEKESELIMTLKRAVLSANREQYDKAEQLLHIALRLAQQQQNSQGVLYCYDLMANLAMERQELQKAEKLFVSVMQMYLSSGKEEDDIKMIHISLKLARIKHLLAEESQAELGYKWCLEKIEKQQNKTDDFKVLYGVIHDWYSQFLLDKGKVQEAIVHLREAYNVCLQVNQYNSEISLILLNDLGITSWRADDIESAQEYLSKAVSIGNSIEEKRHLGVVKANLGLIYLEKGLKDQAQLQCKEAWHLGRKHENIESIQQANYCFEQINIFLNKS